MTQLMIVEDDHNLNRILSLHFQEQGFTVASAPDCAQALAALDTHTDLVLLDQQLPDGNGIDLLPGLLQRRPDLDVIMMTGQHDLELAIQAIHAGAADFIHKPVCTDDLQAAVDKVLARRRVATDHSSDPRGAPPRELIGRSSAMLAVSKQIALCAGNPASVLISGESGTGKEVVARLIHQHSGRSGPFIAINCAAIVDNLLESELFGHEKGAFTGADARKPGKFELARGGTLFLDEIGELAAPLQAKLLRVLQEKTFERVGGTETLDTDARIIAATHRDLFAEAAAGRFREDLAYRLNVINIQMPPLRDRPEDIPLLTQALLQRISETMNLAMPPIQPDAQRLLNQHHWPGNVRELENVLTQALIEAQGGAITPELLHFKQSPPKSGPAGDGPVLRSLDEVEAEHVQRVLDHTGGHKGHSCEILGISRPALDRKIAKYGLHLHRSNESL